MSSIQLTEQDKIFIKVHSLMGESARDIAKQINRSYDSVSRFIRLQGASKAHVYTPQEDALIRRMHNNGRSDQYIADLLHVSRTSIYNRVKRLGCSRPYKT